MAIDPRITQKNADAQLKAGNIDQSQYDTIMKPAQPAVALPISKESQTYKDLTGKGYTDQMIVDAYTKIKAKQTPQVQAVMTKAEAKPQVQPQQEVKGATQNVVAEQVSTKAENQPNLKDITDKRLKEIGNNLKQYEKTNPEMFANQDTFKKAFSYDNRAPEQQAVLDSYFSNVQSVRQQQQQQQNTINSVSKYLSMSGKDILNSGISAVDEQTLSQVSPEKFAEYQAEKEKQTNLSIVNGTASKTMKEQTLADYTTKPVDIVGKYEDSIKELEPLSLDLNTRKTEIEQMEVDMKNLVAETRKQYEGTGATDAYIRRKAAKAYEDMTPDYDAKVRAYNSVLNEYNIKKSTIDKQLELETQQYNMDRQATADKLSALGFYYQYTPEGMGEVSQAKYEAENPDINSKDPAKQKMALNQALKTYYDQYGTIIQRPQAQVVNDVIQYAKDKGITVSQALKENFVAPLQNKSEYKAMVQKSLGIDTKPFSVGDQMFQQQADGSYKNMTTNFQAPTTISQAIGSGMKGAGLRNNNPGNIKDTQFGNVVGTGANGFAQFASPEDGFDALVEKVKYNQTNSKSRYYGKSLLEYFKMYAPSTDGNNPNAYAQEVANRLGVNINTKISDVDTTKFAAAIAKHDSGYDYSTYGQFRNNLGGFNPNYESYYKNYINGQEPSSTDYKTMGLSAPEFTKQAMARKASQGSSFETQAQAKEIADTRKEFNGLQPVKDYRTAKQMVDTVRNSAKLGTAAGDLSLIFAYMKILDPNSTVREGEFANAQNAGGIEDKVANAYNKALKGTRLSDSQRKDFVNTAEKIFGSYEKQYNDLLNQYKTYPVLGGDVSRIGDITTQPVGQSLSTSLGYGTGGVNNALNTVKGLFKY